ncbi:hypothetical protein ACS0TY_032886 [Phlomoides rotata]
MDKLFGPSKRLSESEEVGLATIIANNVKGFYCTFVGRVIKVLNKNSPWYDKCTQCYAILHPEGNEKTASCTDCNNKHSSFTRHYLLRLVVTDGKEEVYATLFDAAESIVGCPVRVFAEKLLTDEDHNKNDYEFYRNLVCCVNKHYKFLVKMDDNDKRAKERAEKKLIIEEVFKVDTIESEQGTSSNKRKIGS